MYKKEILIRKIFHIRNLYKNILPVMPNQSDNILHSSTLPNVILVKPDVTLQINVTFFWIRLILLAINRLIK